MYTWIYCVWTEDWLMKTRVIIAIKLNTVFAIVKKSLEILFLGFIFTTP